MGHQGARQSTEKCLGKIFDRKERKSIVREGSARVPVRRFGCMTGAGESNKKANAARPEGELFIRCA